MKKFIITAALAFASVSVFAQAANGKKPVTATDQATNQRVGMLAERQAKTYEQQYQLNKTQYDAVKAVCLDFAKKVDAPRLEGRQITPGEFQTAMAEKNARFKAIMTPEQYKAYDATLDHSKPQPVPAKAGGKQN